MSQQRAGRHRHKWDFLQQIADDPMYAGCKCGKRWELISTTIPPVKWRDSIVATDGRAIVMYPAKGPPRLVDFYA